MSITIFLVTIFDDKGPRVTEVMTDSMRAQRMCDGLTRLIGDVAEVMVIERVVSVPNRKGKVTV